MTNTPSSRPQPESPGKVAAAREGGGNSNGLLVTVAKPLLLAVVAGIGGVITTVMTPLSDLVSAAIWPPAPEVRIFPELITAKQGDLVRLDLFLYPTSKVAIPTGNLTITYPKDLLQVGAETSPSDLSRVTPEVKAPLRVTGDRPLEFVANLPGDGLIFADFKTLDGVPATAVAKVLITPREAVMRPTYDKIRKFWNITGKWRIILSGAPGEMEIVDHGANVKGSYKLRDGRSGTVDGWHDGDSFNFYLSRGTDNPSQLWTKGPFKKDASSELQIDGTVLLRSPSAKSETGWTEEVYGNGQFSAKAEM